VWMLAVENDGTERKITIPKNLKVTISNASKIKTLFVTNGVAKYPIREGPLGCQHCAGCITDDIVLMTVTHRLVQLMHAAK